MSLNPALFRKPSRYIGSEINSIRKNADVNVALCFPDIYEIGMSHLGLKILYAIINDIPYAAAERVFSPWTDVETALREKGLLLSSLENKRPLRDFHIVGFTIQYELSYTNVLNMLDLGGIPVKSDDRGDDHPLIIAGGPCAVNPLPLKPFIDAFVIGDGEEIVGEIIETYRGNVPTNSSGSRDGILKELSKLRGLYVPSVHSAVGKRVRRRFVDDLDKAPFPVSPVVPYTAIVHDRAAIEIARGCTKGCRFCQAGMIYRPLRERSEANALSLARRSILNTGYGDISFTSLSTGDYSHLYPLIRKFNRFCAGRHISVSLPSLRVGSVGRDVLREIKSVRKTGFTIAPEAGTERLRNVINKDFTRKEYIETLEDLFTEGWRNVKLYFMIGLPTETSSDIEGIVGMVRTASDMGRKITERGVNINVGISAFVPKPHTPFQWMGQTELSEIRRTQDYLRKSFRKKGVSFKGQHVELSLLEAVFSRGDEQCAGLLEAAWRSGCRFDGWSENFRFDKWIRASEETSLDLYAYASRSYDTETPLPWRFIDTGITDEFLEAEYRKALSGEVTLDCKKECYSCGLACRSIGDGVKSSEQDPQEITYNFPAAEPHEKIMPRKYRVRFSQSGILRNLSHQEMINALMRALRRADIHLIYSSGFHPHPRISFGPALPTGVSGMNEYFDIEVAVGTGTTEFLKRVNAELPEGFDILEISDAPLNGSSLNDLISCYEYEILIDNETFKKVESFMNLREHHVTRNERTIDIRSMVKGAEMDGGTLRLTLADTDYKARLYEILTAMFQMSREGAIALSVKRTRLFGYNINTGDLFEPMEEEKIWAEKS
jgi:radical SAM family uncharacterized protein/radical SAM-linked protein